MEMWEKLFSKMSGDNIDDETNAASIVARQRDEEVAAQREIFEATFKEIFAASFQNSAGSDLLRAIVENDNWFVAGTSEGAFDIVEVKAKKYRLAVSSENGVENDKKQGKGGLFLPIYAVEPERATIRMNGCALCRALPSDISGLLLHLPDSAPLELRRECFADLLVLAESCDLEDVLVSPGSDQIEVLQRATFWLSMPGKSLHGDTSAGKGRLVSVYTHPDRAGLQRQNIVAIEGEKLFRLFAENDEIDGLVVNRANRLGRGENQLNGLVLSPGFACRLLAGEDIRPGAKPLPARNREEVELWLQMRNFPHENRQIVEAPLPDMLLMRAVVPQASEWRMQETFGNQLSIEELTWSPVFQLPPAKIAEVSESELAVGPTQILCAGLLAKELNAEASGAEDAANYWRVGRWLPFGRLLDEADMTQSRRRLMLARELAKILPPGAARIPRSALLTVEGAACIGKFPFADSRAWIEETVRQAERYTKRWVQGG